MTDRIAQDAERVFRLHLPIDGGDCPLNPVDAVLRRQKIVFADGGQSVARRDQRVDVGRGEALQEAREMAIEEEAAMMDNMGAAEM